MPKHDWQEIAKQYMGMYESIASQTSMIARDNELIYFYSQFEKYDVATQVNLKENFFLVGTFLGILVPVRWYWGSGGGTVIYYGLNPNKVVNIKVTKDRLFNFYCVGGIVISLLFIATGSTSRIQKFFSIYLLNLISKRIIKSRHFQKFKQKTEFGA